MFKDKDGDKDKNKNDKLMFLLIDDDMLLENIKPFELRLNTSKIFN